jgi:hypothetical protein
MATMYENLCGNCMGEVQLTYTYTVCPNIEKDFTKGNPGLDYKGEDICLPSTTVVLLTT